MGLGEWSGHKSLKLAAVLDWDHLKLAVVLEWDHLNLAVVLDWNHIELAAVLDCDQILVAAVLSQILHNYWASLPALCGFKSNTTAGYK